MDLNAAALFVEVVQYGSLSETARRTNIPVATVSRRIKQLEKDLGFRLLERSTRHLRLTDAGASFLDYAAQGVEAFATGQAVLDRYQVELSGTLRLSLPNGFSPWRRLLHDFQLHHPKVKISLLATDRKVDLIEDGIDVALRVGYIKDHQAVAQKIGTYCHQLVASPSLLEQYDTPLQPDDLLNMPCATWRDPTGSNVWKLGDRTINIAPLFQANDYLHLEELAIGGVCVTELPPFLAQTSITRGHLVPVLADYPFPECDLHLLYPSRKQLSQLVKTYIDFCAERAVDLF